MSAAPADAAEVISGISRVLRDMAAEPATQALSAPVALRLMAQSLDRTALALRLAAQKAAP